MMTPPTPKEIEAAWREIDAAGPLAHDTLDLSILCLRSPRLVDAIKRMSEVYAFTLHVDPAYVELIRPLVMGAVMTGLNYGLRIGDSRVKAALESKP